MKRFIVGLLLVCIVILSAGCSMKNIGNMNFLKSEGKKEIDKDIQKIITAIENKDADSIKEMMADMALEELELQDEDIDSQIQKLFDFYQGNMKSCEYKSGEETTRHGDEGDYGERIIRKAWGTYEVKTDKDDYLIYIYDNVKSVTKEEEGVFHISIIKYNDYYNLNLMGFVRETTSECGVYVTDLSVMEELEQRLNAKGESGFDDIIYGYALSLGCYCENYNKGYVNQIDKFIGMFSNEVEINEEDVKKVFDLLNFNTGEITEIIDSGFNDGDKIMYCDGIISITDINIEDSLTKFRIRVKWQKCEDDSKSGLIYFGLMSEKDYQAGKEFTDGKGLFVIE